jgi:hypothetical protein
VLAILRSVTSSSEHRVPAFDGETLESARDVLTDALDWRLTGPRWVRFRSTAAELGAALRSRDLVAVRAAVADLELCGPVRARPIGGEPEVPAPEPVREEINALVHELEDLPPGRD